MQALEHDEGWPGTLLITPSVKSHVGARSSPPSRLQVILALLLLSEGALLSWAAPLMCQDLGRTAVVQIDRFGAVRKSSVSGLDTTSLKRGDQVEIEFYPSLVFNLRSIDLPDRKRTDQRLVSKADPFFVYPEDSYLLFAKGRGQVAHLHPGLTTVYVVGRGNYRLKLERTAELPPWVVDDSAQYRINLLKQLEGPGECYQGRQSELYGQWGLASDLRDSALARMGWASDSGDSPNLYRFEGVPISDNATLPILVLTLLQPLPDSNQSCGARLRPVAIVLATVAKDFETAQLRYRTGLQWQSVDIKVLGSDPGALGYLSSPLSPGTLEYQICYKPTPASYIAALSPVPLDQWCRPRDPLALVVRESQLPNSVRLQPGLVAVDRLREANLAAAMVLILDRDSYFRLHGTPNFFGGFINPMVGLQVGNTKSQFVMLMGIQLRVLQQGGLVFGWRFGNDPGQAFKPNHNWYLGFSLDPQLFSSLKGQQ